MMECQDQAQAKKMQGLRRSDLVIRIKKERTMRLGRALASWFRQWDQVLVQVSFDQVRAWAIWPLRYKPLLLVLYRKSLAHKHPRTIGHFVRI